MSEDGKVFRFPYRLSRDAFSVRDAARAGEIWRAFQDVAVGAASRAGWPPSRFAEQGKSFVVREMKVVHHRETAFGETLNAASWVDRFRRDTLCTRQVRLEAVDGRVASGTQEWVHVDERGKPCRAERQCVEDLGIHQEGDPSMPEATEARDGAPSIFHFEVWRTWMDPLDHVNHPMYVDFVEEALARRLEERGVAPLSVVPVAERLVFRAPVKAGERVQILLFPTGRTEDGASVLRFRLDANQRERCADGVIVRRLLDDPDGEVLTTALYG